ncbi:MAG: hypothetical protein Q8L81_10480 [Bacteroidota bacterium]|nr:hypothetical protein [Bacteroidota bacterium]
MKPLIIFYSVCILMFYSLIAYIGNRNEHAGNSGSGLLEDVTVSATEYKISKSKILAQYFDNAIIFDKMDEKKLAAAEVYNAIMLLAKHTTSSGDNDDATLNAILKNLSICYIDLARQNSAPKNMNKVFESSELFIAYGFIRKSQQEIKHRKIFNALEDITKAQECLALSAKYVKGVDLKTHLRLLDETRSLVDEITPKTTEEETL